MVHVLFVCTGNTCRSPIAEAILKAKSTDGIEVKSAGIFASNGTPASANTAAVLKEKGIDSNHSSSLLTKELIDWASYILTMTNSHKQEILYRFPEASSKVFTLKEYVGSAGDISDPFGGPVEIYRETYKEMEPIIETLITKFKNA